MKKIITAIIISLSLIGVTYTTATAAPLSVSGSIELDSPRPLEIRDSISFTTSVEGRLRGQQYPLVYVECVSVVDGGVLYGELSYPSTVFVLGGGSSPWYFAENADEDATCTGSLLIYGGKSIVELASTAPFFVEGTPTIDPPVDPCLIAPWLCTE